MILPPSSPLNQKLRSTGQPERLSSRPWQNLHCFTLYRSAVVRSDPVDFPHTTVGILEISGASRHNEDPHYPCDMRH